MGRLGCDMVDLDSMVPMAAGPAEIGPQPVLLGNLDPVQALRNGTPDAIDRGLGRVPSPCRPAVHRRGRLRSAPRHALANVSALTAYARSCCP